VHDSILDVLQEIHKRAPNAKIALMGYPALFENNADCLASRISTGVLDAYKIVGVNGGTVLATLADVMASPHISADAAWMNQVSATLDSSMASAAGAASTQGISVTFSDPTSAFAGQGICGSPQTINDFVLPKTPGENPSSLVSQQSFHPTAAGAANYTAAFNSTLRSMGM
jgi:hypothetical protein